jgi:hypothetical protein
MPTKSYNEVIASLRKEEVPQDIPEEIPEERGEFREPPQPGSYRFRAPAAIENCFDIMEVVQKDADKKPVLGPDGKPVTYQRLNLIFADANALVIVQSPGSKVDNEPFNTRISNVERPRFIGKNQTVKVPDLLYLLRALDPTVRPRTNEEYIALCLKLLPNATFGADIEWNGFCNPKKDARFRFEDEKGGFVYEEAKEEGATENRKGCGLHIYQGKWPKDSTGLYASRAQCLEGGVDPATGAPKCGAWLYPFSQLVRFKA